MSINDLNNFLFARIERKLQISMCSFSKYMIKKINSKHQMVMKIMQK